MIVSHEHRFAYMAPPKTGTTSMADLLMAHYEGVLWEYQETPRENGAFDLHGMGLREEWSDYFVFATVRNPYTHEVSKWDYLYGRRTGSFEQHIKNHCEALCVTLGQDPPPGCVRFKIDAYVRMEHMQEDFEKLPFARKETKIEHLNKYSLLKPLNRSPTRPYQPYTEEMVEIIKIKREIDFDTFGYSTEPPTSPVVSLA